MEEISVCLFICNFKLVLELMGNKGIPAILFVELIRYIWERLKIAGKPSRLNELCARKLFIFMLER